MSIINDKRGIFGEIAALRVSTEGFPKTSISDSIKSITDTKANSVSFLTDLLKSMVGFEALKDVIVETLTQNMDEIEDSVKETLKQVLKGLVSCSINPDLPNNFVNNGITLEVPKIDFLDILKVNPKSKEGKLLYDDVYSASNSTDFNTYLYEVLQNNGGVISWGHQTTDTSILNIKFDEIGVVNNTLNVKPSTTFPSNKLTDLNNAYIDSIKLFNSVKMVNNIIEAIFGSISVELKKDTKVLENEIKIDEIINKVLSADCDDVIDDSFFSFSNEEIQNIEYRARMRRKGVKEISSCGNLESTVSIDDLTSLNDKFEALNPNLSKGEYNERFTNILREGLDNLGDVSAENASTEDKLKVKINFFEDVLRQLMTAIVNVVLSPKMIIIFALNHKIVFGEDIKDIKDFMEKNKWLLTLVLESIRDVITEILLAKALKEIKKLVSEHLVKIQVEKIKSNKAQLLSLTGTPIEVLRKISGLTKT